MNYDDLKEYVAASFEYDWMTLLDIVGYFRENAEDGIDINDLLVRAAAAAAQLVRDGAMIPGGMRDGFQPWTSTPEESAARIEAEAADMAARNHRLNIGEIAWFTAPEDFPELVQGPVQGS
ncbi:hypothetical protein [Allokutzneria sp. NRRL B-24872]|uniref:hypothetical protein n=1 Tax=Allokutzneria sp. NRRL B-24872 TaxID=1137961 RepID=UPI000A3A6D81|nr:hypothetical protein [Allokutzneria sp. NRRL B-24872]